MNLATKPFGKEEPKSVVCPYCGGRKERVNIESATGKFEIIKCGYCNHEGRILQTKGH